MIALILLGIFLYIGLGIVLIGAMVKLEAKLFKKEYYPAGEEDIVPMCIILLLWPLICTVALIITIFSYLKLKRKIFGFKFRLGKLLIDAINYCSTSKKKEK